MLVRSQKSEDEIYAYLEDDKLHFYAYLEDEIKLTRKAKLKHMEPIVKIAAWWLDKNIKISCKVANSPEEKRIGLQNTDDLPDGSGLYFPYKPSSDVTFHQGSVDYSLDILFIRNDEVVKIQANTQPGSSDKWSCSSCDGVLEVRGGFCKSNSVEVGDIISFIGLTDTDLKAFDLQKSAEVDEQDHQSTCGKGYCPDISTNLLGYMSELL